MPFSRIDWLHKKLTETGHEADQRIQWETELAELIDKKQQTRKVVPVVRFTDLQVRWNKEILRGWKSARYRNNMIPKNYYVHHGFVLPPYLQSAFKEFRHGREVFGLRSMCSSASKKKNPVCWACKTAKNRIISQPETLKIYQEQLELFFSRAPVVSYGECEERFKKNALLGQFSADEVQNQKLFHQARELQELKEKRRKEAEERMVRKQKEKEEKEKRWSEGRAQDLKRRGLLSDSSWAQAEETIAERKARIAERQLKVQVEMADFLTMYYQAALANDAKLEAERKAQEKPKKLSLKQRMAAAHKKLKP